jgi:hypothetical protein
MDHTSQEYELAKKYKDGEYTEVQFNYLIRQNSMDKEKMQNLVDYIDSYEPMMVAAKFIILCMVTHFALCFMYAVCLCLRS